MKNFADQPSSPERIIFIAPVWGESYVDTFLKVVVPSLLTDDNLPSLEPGSGTFRILTTVYDARAMAKAPIISDLRNILDVQFIPVDGLVDLSADYRAMSQSYRIGMRETPKDAYFVFLTADGLWSNGTIRALRRRIAEGYYAVMVAGLRVKKNVFLDNFLRLQAGRPGGLNAIMPAELTGIALGCLHPIAEGCNVLGSSFNSGWPSHLYWIEPGRRLVAHGFHLHPLMVKRPERASALRFRGTIDTDFLKALGYPLDKFYIVCDSSELVGIDLTLDGRARNKVRDRAFHRRIGRWGLVHANKYHWHFFFQKIEFAASGVEDDAVFDEHRSALVSVIGRYGRLARYAQPAAMVVEVLWSLLKFAAAWIFSSLYRLARAMGRRIHADSRLGRREY